MIGDPSTLLGMTILSVMLSHEQSECVETSPLIAFPLRVKVAA